MSSTLPVAQSLMRSLVVTGLQMPVVLILYVFFFFSSRRRHTRCSRDWSSDVCSSDLSCQSGRRLLLPSQLHRGLLQPEQTRSRGPYSRGAVADSSARRCGLELDFFESVGSSLRIITNISWGCPMGIRTSSRRSFVKLLAAAPLLSQIAARELYAHAATAIGKDPRQNVYSRLGVKTVINCRGTWTYLSGSLQFPEVRAAQTEAARYFVNMMELQRGVGRRLSELRGAESGMITSGAAGAMAASTAACMAGSDPQKIWQLPDTTGLKHEVIMVGGRSAFDNAIRLTGAKLILVESPDEIANAVNGNTAMIYTTDLGDKLAREVAIAKDHNIPILLDDAAGIPPADNLKLYATMKIDLYTFSGGN